MELAFSLTFSIQIFCVQIWGKRDAGGGSGGEERERTQILGKTQLQIYSFINYHGPFGNYKQD